MSRFPLLCCGLDLQLSLCFPFVWGKVVSALPVWTPIRPYLGAEFKLFASAYMRSWSMMSENPIQGAVCIMVLICAKRALNPFNSVWVRIHSGILMFWALRVMCSLLNSWMCECRLDSFPAILMSVSFLTRICWLETDPHRYSAWSACQAAIPSPSVTPLFSILMTGSWDNVLIRRP